MRYWEDPKSLPIRLAIIRNGWGDVVPNYLFYDLGDQVTLSTEALDVIKGMLFSGREPGFGDIQIHKSRTLKDSYCVRIRNATALQMSMLLNGAERHLYQFGHGDDAGKPINGNFHKLWGDVQPLE